MSVTFLFTGVAAIAFVPVAVLLFLVLDRYAEPNVPKSLFDEKKVMLCFAVGIVLGLVLSVIFVAYAFFLNSLDPAGIALSAAGFLLATALLRRAFVSTKTFGGAGGRDPLLPVHTLAFGAVSGGTIGLGLGLDLFATSPNAGLSTLLLLLGISLDLMLVEAWAGLRFGRAMRNGLTWVPPLPVLLGEGAALLAIAPIFAGEAEIGYGALVVLFAGASYAIYREEPRALRSLRKMVGAEPEGPRESRFGRGAEESPQGAGPDAEGVPLPSKEARPLPKGEPPENPPSP
jgi:hypothetical protein